MGPRAKGLSAMFVAKVTKPGRYGDGGGLYLTVRSTAHRSCDLLLNEAGMCDSL